MDTMKRGNPDFSAADNAREQLGSLPVEML